jgi:hypothetical protein
LIHRSLNLQLTPRVIPDANFVEETVEVLLGVEVCCADAEVGTLVDRARTDARGLHEVELDVGEQARSERARALRFAPHASLHAGPRTGSIDTCRATQAAGAET